MENHTKQTTYKYDEIADKHYFAGFFNLAWNNIEIVFKVFLKKFKLIEDKDKKIEVNPLSFVDNYFKNELALSDYRDRIDFLKQYFPVVQYLELLVSKNNDLEKCIGEEKENKRRECFRAKFKSLIRTINELRNYYTHHYHKPIIVDEATFELLDELFLTVVKEVKRYKMKGEPIRHLFKKELNNELTALIKLKKSELETRRKEGKRVNIDPVSIENAVLNDAFSHLLFGEKGEKFYQSKSTSSNQQSTINISESGLLFLLGMFLHRKESERLRSNIQGFKAKVVRDPEKPIDFKNNSLKYMATHWVFNHLAAKPIKERLNTAFQKETLLLQIADELSKVPDEVYQTFSQEKKNEFLEDINEYFKTGNDIKSFEESRVVHPVIRKRYENKFNYFVLRFLDEFIDFPTLRFQIHLGNYVHDQKEKPISQGTHLITQRIIKEKINLFGKLSEVTNNKTDFFQKLEVAGGETNLEMFPEPSYNFVGNNIPIYLNLAKSKVEGAKELNSHLIRLNNEEKKHQKKRTGNKPDKTAILSEIQISDISYGKPVALLSLNELPALLYELLINGKSGEEIENILVEKLVERYKTINNFSPDNPLPTSQISKKLRKATANERIDIDKLIRAIDREIAVSKEKANLISTKLRDWENAKTNRKYAFTKKELGQEATWLADDIKRFMPNKVKENWKGYQHSHLQLLLAFYESRPNEAYSFIQEFWNLDNDTYLFNRWLKTSFNEKSFHKFYLKYLENRKKYFENIRHQITAFKNQEKLLKKFIEQQHIWSVFYKRLYIVSPIEEQKRQLLLKPLVFTRGIFDPKPTYIEGKEFEGNKDLFADWYQYIHDEEHVLQKFYSWKRDYKELFEKFKASDEFTNNKYQLSEKQQFELFNRKWDKKIRKIIGQDLFLNLIIKRIIKELYHQDVALNLADYYLTQEERIEKEQRAKQQTNRLKGDKSENIINDSFIWNMTISYKTDYINEPAIKLKDIGKFIRFLNDEKVERIFSYTPKKNNWRKHEIEKELEMYEKIRREEVFKMIQELEKKILEKHKFDGINHPDEFEKSGNPNFKKYIAQGVLKKHGIQDVVIEWIENLGENSYEDNNTLELLVQKDEKVQDAFLLIYLRNKFAHNQLPTKEIFDIIVSKTDTKSYVAETLLNYISITSRRILN